ncbi:MAG: N-Acetyl-D-glucosamine ABC transport system, permease protein 1 [Candidatus Bipolaricaulis sibiricus]|uniref:N-Acetyl-D-glucosamine ABC transport system, permease protein 1 n=1 Tax=Bipolaricaulis sibiricus TaxID=2501609 RepID=A0A410FTA8_BIPS1|nr:MAG: N-Acetyl-D-glucosamine ABC transport system, permease protein 1 [Candidatus Bipolaricaulis sibiricus]
MRLPTLRKGRRFWWDTLEAYVYLLPTLAVLGLFTFYPFVNAFLYSVYDIRTRTVAGPVVYTTADSAEWATTLARGRIPEELASALLKRGVAPDDLWVRLRQVDRWVVKDEASGQEYIIVREGEDLRVHHATTGWAMEPVGWANFTRAFRDPDFAKALVNTSVYVGVSVPTTLILALLLATLLHRELRGKAFFRLTSFLPYITPIVAITMVWSWIYDRDFGLLNYFLRSVAGWFGVEFSLLNWLNDPRYVMAALVIMNVWRFVGYQALILLAGMQGIDREYYEAARVDGAGPFAVWRKITVPMVTPQVFFLLIISLIGSFKIFEEVLILLQGPGPQKSALTVVYYVFTRAFDAGHYGLASAASVILFAVIFVLSLFQLTVVQRRVHYER